MVEVRIVYRDEEGRSKSEIVDIGDYEYTIATRGAWRVLIADEEVDFNAGEAKKVRIQKTTVPRDTITLGCPISRHALGSIISVGRLGKPQPVENEREIDYAVFHAVEDGKIKKGDIIGVLNVFPIMMVRKAKKPRKIKEE